MAISAWRGARNLSVTKSARKQASHDDLEKARRKPSAPAPEVRDGLTERAEALEVNLRLSEAQRKEAETWIFDRMDEGFRSTSRREALDRIRLARERYEHGVARDDMPFDNAHDVRLRWGAAQADTFSVRLSEGLFGQDPLVRVSPRGAASVEKAPRVERFLDWWHDEYWRLGDRGPDITDNVTREGHRVLHLPYRLEIEPGALQQIEKQKFEDPVNGRSRWVDVDSMDEMVRAIEDGLRAVEEYRLFEVKKDKVLMNGPDLEDLPLEDYLWPHWATPANEGELPWEAVRQWHYYDAMKAMDADGDLYPGALAKVEKNLVTPPSRDRGHAGGDAMTGEPSPRAGALDAMVETWLWYGLYRLPGSKRLSRVIALVHAPSRTLLWMRPYRFEHWESPVTHIRFLELSWRFDGVGAMELFDSIEQAAQNLINYALDDTYMRAATEFTYREGRFSPDDHPLKPWRGLAVKSHNDVHFISRQDRRPTDINLMQLLLGFGEQRVNIGPYQQGQESARNSRPTARGIFMLLDQASKLFNRAVRGQLKSWKSVFRKEVALWQQTMPEYMAVDAVGEDGAALFPTGIGRRYIVGKFSFELSGNVENVLYEADRQTSLAMYDLFKDNPLVKSSLTAFYNLTEDVWRSFKRKRKLLPPLDELQKKLNLLPTPPPMTGQAQKRLVAELKARGLKEAEIEAVLEKALEVPVDAPAGGGGPRGAASPPGQEVLEAGADEAPSPEEEAAGLEGLL
jgi:hypothetical protein